MQRPGGRNYQIDLYNWWVGELEERQGPDLKILEGQDEELGHTLLVWPTMAGRPVAAGGGTGPPGTSCWRTQQCPGQALHSTVLSGPQLPFS